MKLVISKTVRDKLTTRHGVTQREVEQCFTNRTAPALVDDREEHRTDPPSMWFVAKTNKERWLKVVFMLKEGQVHIKTCYTPNQMVIDLYRQKTTKGN